MIFLHLSLDFGTPGLGSMLSRFRSALGGNKSPTQCPGLAEDQQHVCRGAQSPYNGRLGQNLVLSFEDRCVCAVLNRQHSMLEERFHVHWAERIEAVKRVWVTDRTGRTSQVQGTEKICRSWRSKRDRGFYLEARSGPIQQGKSHAWVTMKWTLF